MYACFVTVVVRRAGVGCNEHRANRARLQFSLDVRSLSVEGLGEQVTISTVMEKFYLLLVPEVEFVSVHTQRNIFPLLREAITQFTLLKTL